MKRLFAFVLTAILCLCCLASCSIAHKENTWFSEEKLAECLVGDLPTITKDYVKHNDEDIYVSFTSKEREAYVAEVFEYLKSQDFKYLGTRGEQASTLAGSFTTYYFKPATELSEFYVGSSYKFVYSDGTLDEDGDLIFCIINIYDYEPKNLEYGTKDFSYNTLITIRYKSEAPLSGRYALKEYEISYQDDETESFLIDGFAPTEAKPGDSVVLRTNPIMDADLAFYANGVKLTQTHADSDYWEYVFIMPDEDVVITHEITDGFLQN